MATFGELKTQVSGRLLDPNSVAVSSSDVAASINQSIKYWKVHEFDFNKFKDSVTLTLQDGTIPLTGDFLAPVDAEGAFNIEYSSQRYNLVKVSEDQYNAKWRGNGYGIPQIFARIGQSYEVFPLPDRAYTLNRHFLKDYTDLSDSSDTNDFTINADRLIMLWSVANLIAEFRQDEKMETYFRNAARDEAENLGVLTDKLETTGRLETENL